MSVNLSRFRSSLGTWPGRCGVQRQRQRLVPLAAVGLPLWGGNWAAQRSKRGISMDIRHIDGIWIEYSRNEYRTNNMIETMGYNDGISWNIMEYHRISWTIWPKMVYKKNMQEYFSALWQRFIFDGLLMAYQWTLHGIWYIYIWVNYNDLTATSLES